MKEKPKKSKKLLTQTYTYDTLIMSIINDNNNIVEKRHDYHYG